MQYYFSDESPPKLGILNLKKLGGTRRLKCVQIITTSPCRAFDSELLRGDSSGKN